MATEQRLIDVNARIEEIRKAYCTNCDNYDGVRCRSCWVDDGIGSLEDVTIVDAVEVVRCKDCKYQGRVSCPTYYEDRMTYRDCWALDGDNDFCSQGERREGE